MHRKAEGVADSQQIIFQEVADIWWTTVQAPIATVAHEDAWTTFTKEFDEKSISAHVKAHKLEEFERFVQGIMSMQDYEFHFT